MVKASGLLVSEFSTIKAEYWGEEVLLPESGLSVCLGADSMGLPRFLGVRHPDCETEGSPGHEADAAADSSDSGPTKT